jgi:hypothetical protein
MGARFTPPRAFGHLTMWIVVGDDELPVKAYVPLDEAMQAKHVTVHETGEVDKLRVEISGEHDVFIQAGDIVKGGRQDRVVRGDFIVSQGSIVIPAFCVEQARWAQRGDEPEASFSDSRSSIVGKSLKMKATLGGSQMDVWSDVAATQARLSQRIGHSVVSEVSRSSLNLSLENEVLSNEISRYVAALVTIADEHPDAIGFAYALEGEPAGLEVYGSRALFRAMWPKMLRAAVTEAVGDLDKPKATFDPQMYFERKLTELSAITPIERMRTGRVRVVAREDSAAVLVETIDEKFGRVLHRRLIPKAA